MRKWKGVTALTLMLLAWIMASSDATAAVAMELTPAVKAAFDLTAASAESPVKDKLTGLYSELSTLKQQYDKREEQIRVLHSANDQALIAVRAQIKEINQAEITRLEGAVNSSKQRYQPLFDQYSALNSRIALAKKLKDKTLNSVLRTQADAMLVLVKLGRQDIRDKQNQLKAAKDVRTKKTTAARKTLSGMDSIQVQIKTGKSTAAALSKRLSADWTDFKAATRKKNPALTLQSLSSLVSGYRQMAVSKQKIIDLEQKVAAVISSTKNQIES